MFKFKYFRWTLLMLLFLFVILSSLNVGVAEFYSRSIYPSLSYALSALSSVVPFSLDEVGIFLMIRYIFDDNVSCSISVCMADTQKT